MSTIERSELLSIFHDEANKQFDFAKMLIDSSDQFMCQQLGHALLRIGLKIAEPDAVEAMRKQAENDT